MLIVVCGLPGAGKSTVAAEVATRLDAEHLRTDVVRKDIVSDPQYTDAEKRRVYDRLVELAREELTAGRSVVVDGTFSKAAYRQRALRVARRADASAEVLKVECDPSVARDRIRQRSDDPSEADVEVRELYREAFEPIRVDHRVVDNSGALSATLEQVEAVLGRAATGPS